MADALKRADRVLVHQALHGYSDGHRLLACSTNLTPRDAKSMLIFSDASGPGARIDERGYLTGYPLADSNVYALAWTWPAPEMPRPGCVWTHTLLIDFADLAELAAPEALIGAFSRPSVNPVGYGYELPTTLDLSSNWAPTIVEIQSLRPLISALYGHARDRIVATRPALASAEQLILAIWGQQWPRLRRSFRFCTMAFADRSVDSAPFDLQLVPSHDRSLRSRFSMAIDADKIVPEQGIWVHEALNDLVNVTPRSLRAFLLQAGGDAMGGRELFAPLCSLYALTREFKTRPSAVDDAIALLEDTSALSPAQAARSLVTRAAAKQVKTLSVRALQFLLSHIDLSDQRVGSSTVEEIARALWSQDPGMFPELMRGSLSGVAKQVIDTLPVRDLLGGLRHDPGLVTTILGRRPEIITLPEFWRGADEDVIAVALQAASFTPERIAPTVSAMFRSSEAHLAKEAARFSPFKFDLSVLLDEIDRQRATEHIDLATVWLSEFAQNGGAVARALSSGRSWTRRTLASLARVTAPDMVPNDYGEDPWVTAIRASVGGSDEYLAAYLLARALGYRSNNPAELIAASFDDVYHAALQSIFPEDAWQLVESRLPWHRDEWDRCSRLRAAVVNIFVDRELAPEIFGRVTADDQIFAMLAETASRRAWGRSFLRRVRRALSETEPKGFAPRMDIINDVLS